MEGKSSIWLGTPAQSLVILFVTAVFLGGCSRFNPSLFVDEPYATHVPYPNAPVFNFGEYAAFADGVADKWDSRVKLDSIARHTPCDTVELTAGQQMRFSYYRPRLYWFGQRIEWEDIVIFPDEGMATASVFTSLNASWDNPPIDWATLIIDYNNALQMADESGGAAYKASHLSCFQSVELRENQWRIKFTEDDWGVSADVFRVCIDGLTGEPCEWPADADPPS
ncbi:MAG: hypothetical protein U0X20_14815 [Caldilineaceae bacterium]